MSLNQDKLKAKLASLDKNQKGSKKLSTEDQEKIKRYIWKPEPGKQVIRIVPYQFQIDFPFIELKFHYDFLGDKISYLSPSTVNKADPIVELANKLEKSKDTWLKGRKMQPKLRTYVPIIVRGKESEGVKFWGFGVQVCKQIMDALADPDYGDITDLVNGYDITVDFKTAEDVKKDFPETSILIKPKPRPVIDPTLPNAKDIMESILKKQVNIFDIYKPATYDELAAVLEIKLENERNGLSAGSSPRGADRTVSTNNTTQTKEENVVLPSETEIAKAVDNNSSNNKEETSSVVSPSAQKSHKTTQADVEEAFAKLFPK